MLDHDMGWKQVVEGITIRCASDGHEEVGSDCITESKGVLLVL